MTIQPHDQADPLQQCGYCLGWAHEELWRRLELKVHVCGDCIDIWCRECGYTGQYLARLGYCPTDVGRQVVDAGELMAAGERHVIEHHS